MLAGSRHRSAAGGLPALAALAAVAMAVAAPAGHAANTAGPGKPADHTVKAPHYGDVLFYFFQDRSFPALTSLMVSQQFERLPQHEDEAEILRGGLLLSYGLHREAGDIFSQLIERGATPATRDRAWYFLAKIRYQRGEMARAAEAIDHIEHELPGAMEEERLLLDGQIRLGLGDASGAAQVLQPLLTRPPVPVAPAGSAPAADAPKRSFFSRVGSWLWDAVTFSFLRKPDAPVSTTPAYARFNLGVAKIRSGDEAGGRKLLDELGQSSMADEETRALRDQANVALGFASLAADEPEAAAKALERVRLQGPYSNKALLGFGWAAAAQKKPAQALVPWMELASRDPSDAAVLEARIAVPYALAELGAYGQALARYQEAIAAYEKEGKALDESIVAIRDGKLVSGLMDSNPAEDMGWFQPVAKLPDMPYANHLAPVLAQHEFQEAFKNYRDLAFVDHNLTEWQDKLDIYRDMIDTRRQAFAERLPQTRQRASELRVDTLQRQRDALAAEFQTAEAAGDGAAYADADQRVQRERIARSRELLVRGGDALNGELDSADVAERLRRVEGALTWNLAQQEPDRRWAVEKGLRDIDSNLAEAREHDASLAQAEKDEPGKFARYADRLAALSARIKALQPRVAALSAEQQRALQDIAVAVLKEQQVRLTGYGNQAKYAVAELYDRATQKPADTPAGGDRAKP